jgi:hypothetical protein
MSRHYSTKLFFRSAPNILEACNFKENDTLTDFDFVTQQEGKPNGFLLSG